MPGTPGVNYSGWFKNAASNRLDFYYKGTRIGHLNANGMTLVNGGITNGRQPLVARLGTSAAVASDGSDAILPNTMFVAPAQMRILSAWRMNISASDVTKGTATSSASYRRLNLIANTAATGSGTTIVASLNATASAASLVTRAFATVANLTIPAGAIILASHLSVGAATGDGTDMAANIIEFAYDLV